MCEWASMLMSFLEKETSDHFTPIREKIIYLLANAYIQLHQSENCLVYLQLCVHRDSVPIQYLYLLYYVDQKNISNYYYYYFLLLLLLL